MKLLILKKGGAVKNILLTLILITFSFIACEDSPTSPDSVNSAPIITSAPSVRATSGKCFTYTIIAEDSDGDALIFRGEGVPAGAVIDSLKGILTWNVPEAELGTSKTVHLIVDDGKDKDTLALQISITSAAIFNVPGDYSTIQSALDSLCHGDTILVQPGVYKEKMNFNGKEIVLASKFITTGDSAYLDSTILDGENNGVVITMKSAEPIGTAVIGFTLTNGLGFGNKGGAIDINGASPLFYRCIFSNSVSQGG